MLSLVNIDADQMLVPFGPGNSRRFRTANFRENMAMPHSMYRIAQGLSEKFSVTGIT